MTRRSFLAAASLAPLGAFASVSTENKYHYHDEHIVGTSMDLVVWCRDSALAERAHETVIAEIRKLNAVLNTRVQDSEISRMSESASFNPSRELRDVLEAYAYWERQTGGLISLHPGGPDTPRNIDALGKAYIIDQSVAAVRVAFPSISGLLLNIGGDIVAFGNKAEIAIADPTFPQENAPPISKLELHNAAVATSGTYARGAHLVNGRTGQTAQNNTSATVIAPDAVTANALATMLCVADGPDGDDGDDGDEGLRLVEGTPVAEALRIGPNGFEQRTSGFARFEKPHLIRTAMVADWPSGYQLTISLVLTAGQPGFGGGGRGGFGGRGRPQYVAIWVENGSGKLVRTLALWANKPQYYRELSSFFSAVGRDQNLMYSIARATRPPGTYEFVWDGLDDQHKPVPLGNYKIVVETNQEHGSYGKQSGTISCVEGPATLTLPSTANYEPVMIQYGPRQNRA